MSTPPPTIAVLISGRGSNLRTLIAAQDGYTITEVLSNKADAGGLEFARKAGIATSVYPRSNFASVAEQKAAIFSRVAELNPTFCILAGFMMIVPQDVTARHPHWIVNIHPALLPALPGLHPHARAVAERHAEHGCTVHFVDAGIDTGPIIAQAAVPLLTGDTEESLAGRVLDREHELFPWVIQKLARREIRVISGNLEYSISARTEAYERNFRLPRYD